MQEYAKTLILRVQQPTESILTIPHMSVVKVLFPYSLEVLQSWRLSWPKISELFFSKDGLSCKRNFDQPSWPYRIIAYICYYSTIVGVGIYAIIQLVDLCKGLDTLAFLKTTKIQEHDEDEESLASEAGRDARFCTYSGAPMLARSTGRNTETGTSG